MKKLFIIIGLSIASVAYAESRMPRCPSASCPHGWSAQGDYCVRKEPASVLTKREGDTCPGGYKTFCKVYCYRNE
jgi:hypothetical protein